MQLFKKYSLEEKIKNQNQDLLRERWGSFQKFLNNIEWIKNAKEEVYQDGFLQDVFERCLGYTLDRTDASNYNLEREKKNSTDSKKADGAIIVNGHVVGVIELKGQDTKNFETKGKNVIEQAFGYLVSHNRKYAHYVILSNFDKLRFYIDDKLNYQEFSLFNLTYEQFEELHYLLCYENISKNIPLLLKEQESIHQENISNKIYKQYSQLRVQLLNNLIDNNVQIDKNVLLAKTQKILDRMIFIFFAEDRGIIPADTIGKIIEQFQNDYRHESLYSHYKIYFDAINRGNDRLNIAAYNGGLFATDEILDNLIVDDTVLQEIPSQLTKYDFNSDIDVNILGHIFENSLSDIEEIKASINDDDFDKKKTKRKKDGVFYTPEYITKYIVENTLGKLCEEKKTELGLTDIDIQTPNNYKKLNKTELEQQSKLENYREYLLDLKIVDPACGSGAFLNQALNYLLQEHNFIDDGLKTLTGDLLGLYDIKKEVLEHNLYGVDINEEAVEIAKLSLWLRTVESGRPLTKLAQKLKVGNSLIDDKSVVPNAFEWEKEFPEVFAQGGFDVVIGNPPYIMEDDNRSAFIGLHDKLCYQGKTDLWHLFTCKGIQLSKANGIISYIAKNQWLNSAAASNMRKIMYENTHIDKIIDFGTNMIFENVGQQTMIFFLTKNSHNQEHQIDFIKFKNKITNIEIISILFNDIENENIEISTKILPKIYDEKENLTFSSDVNELSPLNKQVKFTQVV